MPEKLENHTIACTAAEWQSFKQIASISGNSVARQFRTCISPYIAVFDRLLHDISSTGAPPTPRRLRMEHPHFFNLPLDADPAITGDLLKYHTVTLGFHDAPSANAHATVADIAEPFHGTAEDRAFLAALQARKSPRPANVAPPVTANHVTPAATEFNKRESEVIHYLAAMHDYDRGAIKPMSEYSAAVIDRIKKVVSMPENDRMQHAVTLLEAMQLPRV